MEILILDEQSLYEGHDRLRDLAEFALEREGSHASTELSIALVSGEEMAELNQKYLGRTGTTDVLSFFMGESDDEAFILGDVIICAAEAESRAVSYGVQEGEGVLLALVHGILHLMGYDDKDEEGNLEMDEAQLSLLEEWKAR